jgi:SAM-dependent methyltransferase
MFDQTAALYDLIYASFKDYVAESDRLAALIARVRPGARTVLDVACGTGEHARLLHERHGLRVDGIDLQPEFAGIAAEKNPGGRFVVADMCDFDLGRRYDVVMCLFSSIGYLRTIDRVTQAIGRFRAHTAPGGVIIVEPWFAPGILQDGRTSTDIGERDGIRVARRARTEVDGRLSRLHFDYDVVDHGRPYQAAEVHELGLFTPDEMIAAFESNGLTVEYDPVGLIGRGLYVARDAGR